MYVCTYVCVYICMYVGIYARMYVCMYVCVYVCTYVYRIRGLFGGDFNLVVWPITSELPNLNRAILKVIFLKLNQSLYTYRHACSSLAKAYT